MQEDTCKKIKKSLRFEKGGEAIYVEIGMENIPSRIETKKVVAFLKTLFEEAIDQLEVPGTPDAAPKAKGSTHGPSAEDVREAVALSEKEFEKLMDGWLRKNQRATFSADTVLQPGMVFDITCDSSELVSR